MENKALFSNAKISVSNVYRNSDLTAGFSRACRISRPFATVKVSTNNRSYVLLRFYETFFRTDPLENNSESILHGLIYVE